MQTSGMHERNALTEELTSAIIAYALERMALDPPPLDGPATPAELAAAMPPTVTPNGIGGLEALRLFGEVLAPACISVDHPRFLSFVPAAPTEASILFDLIVGASNIYGGSWLEGGGAIYAENEALRWIAGLAGFPATAGGVFVSGGSAGNLSALIAARWAWRHRTNGANDRRRGIIIAAAGAHSSVAQAASSMDADIVVAPTGDDGSSPTEGFRHAIDTLAAEDRERVFAVVSTAGTTNAGIVENLMVAADAADELGVWFHVDGAYGAAALAAPSARHRFAGIERADSLIVDPHKWLFGPYDSCALVYRDPNVARAAHTQRAEYLDVLNDHATAPWNASDYAHHLSRRARGLPLWFSLATHGTDAYSDAIESTLAVAHAGAELIRASDHLELVVEPQLSIAVFRRIGWTPNDYAMWSERQLAEQTMFVVPTSWRGETVLRYCIINPLTTVDDLAAMIESLADQPGGTAGA